MESRSMFLRDADLVRNRVMSAGYLTDRGGDEAEGDEPAEANAMLGLVVAVPFGVLFWALVVAICRLI